VLFIPVGIPPHKKKIFASAVHRLKMLKIAVNGNSDFEVSEREVRKKTISYTYKTVTVLKKENQGCRIFLIVGQDSFNDVPNWYEYKKLVAEVTFLVAPRNGKLNSEFIKNANVKYKIIDSPKMGVSSSYIRNCLFYKKSVKYLVPDPVIEYINKEKLYGFKRNAEKI
jgi:nicotinate-nucleotide adenylyltransferase